MTKQKPTLNVGCGLKRWGDVRIDVERYSSVFYLEKTSTNLIADIQFLPLQNRSISETKCLHVLEHVENPKLAFHELKRVSEKLTLKVPIWHFYTLLIESISLFIVLMFRPKLIRRQTRQIHRWKKRLRRHKWYIHLKNAKINRIYGIPYEYEKSFIFN